MVKKEYLSIKLDLASQINFPIWTD